MSLDASRRTVEASYQYDRDILVSQVAAEDTFEPREGRGSPPLPTVKGAASRLASLGTDALLLLIALAAINAIFITWATVLDTRRASALARALGATPRQMTAGLAAAQALPALAGGLIEVPTGIALFAALNPSRAKLSPHLWMVAVALGAPLITAALTALPARIGANRPVAAILQSELA